MSEAIDDQGTEAFYNLVANIVGQGGLDTVRANIFRRPHPDFPVSKKGGIKFEEKEDD